MGSSPTRPTTARWGYRELKRSDPAVDVGNVKVLTLRRPDSCSDCGAVLTVGTRAVWESETRQVRCLACSPGGASTTTPGPGASAQDEYDKRSARREQRVHDQHPRLGRLLLAITEEPASTRVWAQGAAGERAVAAVLDDLAAEQVLSLHDRRLRRPNGTLSRANIDHLAVTGTGVWVIDAKTHQGALEVRRVGGLLTPRTERLYVGGRDRTSLVHGLIKQVDAVREALSSSRSEVPVQGALCFVGTELPWFGSSSIAGVPLIGRPGLARLLRRAGSLGAEQRAPVALLLGQHFPPAM